MKVTVVTGTRPQIIKSAPLIQELERVGADTSFIHTGQHYDYELASQFIEELSIKEPDYNLRIGSGTGVFQTTEILTQLSKVLSSERPDYLVVPGDTNSALGAALTGFKMDIPTCHLESGLRSFDMNMQEEINRRIIDHGAAALFAPTSTAIENLEKENVRGSVYLIGDTMYDILKDKLQTFRDDSFQNSTMEEYEINSDEFALLTFHRRENVDIPFRLRGAIDAFSKLECSIVFPMHPRTKKCLKENNIELSPNISIVPPLSYTKMMALVSRSSLLLTDSGGLQKEAYWLNTPCITIRDNTEWVETLEAGANILAAPTVDDITSKFSQMWKKKLNNDPAVYGDGSASIKAAKILDSGEIVIKSNLML